MKTDQRRLVKIRKIKKRLKTALGIIIVIGIIGGFVWLIGRQKPLKETDIISRSGIHWHSQLDIIIKEEKQTIPANIGIGLVHAPIHTHDDSGTLHLEFSGLVKKEDIKLGQFFKIWGKPFHVEGTTVKMSVNGKENTEFENYLMQDKDQIEIRYE